MALSEKSQFEIYRTIVKEVFRKEGLHFKGVDREFGNLAKKIGRTKEEVREALKPIIDELVAETFGK